MAGDDAALRVDQDRIGPAELDDRGCDLRDLAVVVRAGVARIGNQPIERPVLDRIGQSRGHVVRVGLPRQVVTVRAGYRGWLPGRRKSKRRAVARFQANQAPTWRGNW